MRDLLFKNLTSVDGKRRRITNSEIVCKEGVRSIIRRHFVYLVKEINPEFARQGKAEGGSVSQVYILKEHSRRDQREKFFCKIKSSIYAMNRGKLLQILFMHTLKITLIAMPLDLMKYSKDEKGSSI
jgi:hypothetical protein